MISLVHVLAAFGVVAALAVEWTGHALMGRPDGMRVLAWLRFLGPPTGIALLASGLWLAWGRWEVGWIDVALGAMVGVALAGGLITGRTMARLRGATPGPLDARWLGVSLRLRSGLVGAIAVLMVLKPALPVALAVVAAGAALALVSGRRATMAGAWPPDPTA